MEPKEVVLTDELLDKLGEAYQNSNAGDRGLTFYDFLTFFSFPDGSRVAIP